MSDGYIGTLVDPQPNSAYTGGKFTQARTATAAGTGTGQVGDRAEFVIVTSDDANKIITLPDAAVGSVVALRNGATGYELRSHAPATVAINGGSGSGAESAIAADTLSEIEDAISATSIRAVDLV